ncbi:hypothetical protein LCGC14_1810970 [marine sediment metagenome]|uniref:Resolvase HTH domain-containing protein n=1 Tax=marine sediment metagenome TaxID=412755 RepID=A0A0F9H9W7_9ZZZZ
MTCHPGCGCVVASCCFKCPLEACIYESGGHGVARLREVQIAALPELNREKVAETVGCSERTVYRARKRNG